MRPSTNAIPTVDLDVWRADPTAVAAQVDTALQRAGFLLVTGHGVDAALRAGVRAAARRFFALPDEVKQRYAVRIGGRGWLAPGVEANGLVEGTETPPDLKESFAVGPDTPTGDAAVDAVWFPPNVWPAEVPELRAVVTRYTSAMRRVADDLLELCATALGLPVATLDVAGHEPDVDVQHQPLPTVDGGRAARRRSVPDRAAHRLRHGHRARPGAGSGRAAGVRHACRTGHDPDGPGVWQDAPYDPERADGQHRRPARATGPGCGGARAATACCRRRPRIRTRS